MIALYIFLGLLGAFILFAVFPTFLISFIIFEVLFVRNKKDKWGRTVSWDDEEQKRMFAEGKEWGEENEQYRHQIRIKNDGFNLVGEFFDFGFDRSVIIIPGRMESGTYSYYFSIPYKKAGYNVLAIDNRSHGLSEGRYNTLGLKEHRDIVAWAKYLHDEHNQQKIVIHGICIGSATGLYALLAKNSPNYLVGLVADGMYVNFNESLNNHLIERNKPIFPFSMEIMWLVSLIAGKSPKKYGPINLIGDYKKPILFIYSKEDTYSVPEKSQLLFDACGSEHKKLVWFDHGAHSHVRINAPEKYDQTIIEFLKEEFDE